MGRLVWDQTGEHLFETGVNQGVLYLQNNLGVYDTGVVWNGLTSVSESPEGAEATKLYADDIKYLNLISAEEFKCSVEAYTYPDEFADCDGSAEIATGVMIGQQNRKTFGLSYKTTLGNDTVGNGYGYKLHLIYGCQASPSEKSYSTINDSPEAITFSWEINTTPVPVANNKPTATIIIDSTKCDKNCLKVLEAILYGAFEFSEAETYAIGDVVTYGEGTSAKLYKCTTAVTTPGAWSESNWTEISGVADGPRLPLPAEVKTIMTPAV